MAMSAGLVGAIVVLMAGAPGLRKDTVLSLRTREFDFGADAIATLTKGSNSLTDSPRDSSPMQSASGEAVGAPVALRGLASPATGDSGSAQVKADNFELKSVDLGAERVLAGAPEPTAPAHAMASPARFTVGIADGPSSTLTTAVAAAPSQSAGHGPDPATSPPPDGTPIAPVSSTATQGLPATEAPKPATEREPEPAAPAQAIDQLIAVPCRDRGRERHRRSPPPSRRLYRSLLLAIWIKQPRPAKPDATPVGLFCSESRLAGDRGSEARNPSANRSRRPTRRRPPARLSPRPDRGRNVIDAHHPRCGALHRSLLMTAEISNLIAAERDATPAGLFGSGSGLAGDRGAEARNRARTEEGGLRAGDRQFAQSCRDRGRSVIDAHHPRCGAQSIAVCW